MRVIQCNTYAVRIEETQIKVMVSSCFCVFLLSQAMFLQEYSYVICSPQVMVDLAILSLTHGSELN